MHDDYDWQSYLDKRNLPAHATVHVVFNEQGADRNLSIFSARSARHRGKGLQRPWRLAGIEIPSRPMPHSPKTAVITVTMAPAVPSDACGLDTLAQAFLDDRCAQLEGLPSLTHFVVSDEPLPSGAQRLLPHETRLGESLARAAEAALAQHAVCMLVDRNAPNLPTHYLQEAIAALAAETDFADVVLGPTWDGNAYLIGLRTARPSLLQAIGDGEGRWLVRVLDEARAQGLRLHVLPSWYVARKSAMLSQLAFDLATTSRHCPGYPKATAKALAQQVTRALPSPRNEHWRTLSSARIYQNPWLRVDEHLVEVKRGTLTLYGVVTMPRSVGIVPILADGRVLLIKQFRYVAGRDTWEIPSGGVDDGESLEESAARELVEECGFSAASLTYLTAIHTSKSVMAEVAHLFLASGLTEAQSCPDDTEQIEVRAVSFAQALSMVREGEIVDAMSVTALLWLAREKRAWPAEAALAEPGST